MPPTAPPRPPPPPPPPPPRHEPRLVLYHQTHYHRGAFVSALPLVTECTTSHIPLTHLIIAALHLNDPPGHITLNDDPPFCEKHAPLWEEVRVFQDVGVRVLGMLGGAARGSFARLDGGGEAFEAHYAPLRDVIRQAGLDGLDLDVEEEMSLGGVVRLIDRLKGDFGGGFEVTLAPVAGAMVGGRHLSGFDYEVLEMMRGGSISAYHVQFYNGWGDVKGLGMVLARGWRQEKIVVGVLTNPRNGNGHVAWSDLRGVMGMVRQSCPGIGGVMGWEYFNCVTGGEGREGRPWEWAEGMWKCLRE